jgi:hypothetical protein
MPLVAARIARLLLVAEGVAQTGLSAAVKTIQ